MTTLREAAQQALEAWDGGDTEWFKRAYTVMEALRAALADPVQEPVAWMYEHDGMVHDADNPPFFMLNRWATPVNEPYTETPLYTAPPKRKPLTEEEILDLWAGVSDPESPDISMIDFARAIERAHGVTP